MKTKRVESTFEIEKSPVPLPEEEVDSIPEQAKVTKEEK